MKLELADAIKRSMQDIVDEVHTALPGVILKIDYDEGTCSVQPYALYKTVTGDRIMYPEIYHVPIIVPQSSMADTCVAYPILPGDTCLLIISEGTIDYWKNNRVTEWDSRFDLTNAICIPGLMRSFNPCFKEAANDGAVILKYGDGKLRLTNDELRITVKDININATGKIEINASGNVSMTSGGNVGMSGSGNVSVSSGGTMAVSGSGNTSVTSGSNLTIQGSRVDIN